jgi:hypothetical protein
MELKKITKKQESKRAQKLFVGAILFFVIFFSVIGYSFNTTEKVQIITYKGVKFENKNDLWLANVNNKDFAFKYNPYEVEDFKIFGNLTNMSNYYDKPLYIYSESQEAEVEVYRNLQGVFQRMQKACMENQNCSEELPIKTCEDNFIIIKQGNTSEITQSQNCVFINGLDVDIIKLTDKFLYGVLEI